MVMLRSGVTCLACIKVNEKANCLNLHVGFESADQGILKRIKKVLRKIE